MVQAIESHGTANSVPAPLIRLRRDGRPFANGEAAALLGVAPADRRPPASAQANHRTNTHQQQQQQQGSVYGLDTQALTAGHTVSNGPISEGQTLQGLHSSAAGNDDMSFSSNTPLLPVNGQLGGQFSAIPRSHLGRQAPGQPSEVSRNQPAHVSLGNLQQRQQIQAQHAAAALPSQQVGTPSVGRVLPPSGRPPQSPQLRQQVQHSSLTPQHRAQVDSQLLPAQRQHVFATQSAPPSLTQLPPLEAYLHHCLFQGAQPGRRASETAFTNSHFHTMQSSSVGMPSAEAYADIPLLPEHRSQPFLDSWQADAHSPWDELNGAHTSHAFPASLPICGRLALKSELQGMSSTFHPGAQNVQDFCNLIASGGSTSEAIWNQEDCSGRNLSVPRSTQDSLPVVVEVLPSLISRSRTIIVRWAIHQRSCVLYQGAHASSAQQLQVTRNGPHRAAHTACCWPQAASWQQTASWQTACTQLHRLPLDSRACPLMLP